ncbi:MAG: hypothetical protein ACRDNW_03610 [Trebonia sp.]
MRAQPHLRAIVNAWLEEISFRTGMMTAAIALAALLAIATAAVFAATASHGRAAGAVTADHPPRMAPPVPAMSAAPSKPAVPSASTKPKAKHPVPTHATGTQPAIAPAPRAPAPREQASSSAPASPQDGWRGYGPANPRGDGHPFGGDGHGHGNFRFPGPGRGWAWQGHV